MLETRNWKTYRYRHNITKPTVSYDRKRKQVEETEWPPKFYVSERGFAGKCWSVDIPYIHGTSIHSFGIIFRSDIFPNSIRPQKNGFGIVFHYPNHLSRADIGTYEWKSHEVVAPNKFTMSFKIENMLVMKRRNKANVPCNENWKYEDNIIYTKIFMNSSCKPSFWKMKGFEMFKICSTKKQMKDIFSSAINIKTESDYPPPCQEIEKIIYTYDEFDWLVDNWIVNEGNMDSSVNTEKIFEILFNFVDGTYMEIQHAKAYDEWYLIGNAGGFIGLFLGCR